MILAHARYSLANAGLRPAFVLILAATATNARADVLELDADGARWVAGGPITPRMVEAQAPNPFDVNSMPASMPDNIPVGIMSDPRILAAGIPPRYVAKVAELSQRYNLSPRLIEALVWQESRWQENAVSPAGARGLTQLMPGTARYLGVNPDDPMQNLEGGARYLREQLDRFGGNLEKALAAYNAGPGRVIRAGGVPNIRETRNYVAAIMGRLASQSLPSASQ